MTELSKNFSVRLPKKIVQGHEARDYRRQRGGNLWVGGVGHVFFVVYNEAVNFGAKRVPHLASCTAELDDLPTQTHIDPCESLRGQPLGDRLNIGVRRTKLFAK